MPKMIILKYTPSNDSECCVPQVLPLFGRLNHDINEQHIVEYVGTFVGHAVAVYISRHYVDTGVGYDDGASDYIDCQWTIRIPTLGVDEVIEIDHVTVTSLGVPAISIENVPAFGGCLGTLSIQNFETAKLPFQSRKESFDWAGDPGDELTLPLPYGYTCGECEKLPRYICLTGDIHVSGGHLMQWHEMTYDESFIASRDDYDDYEWIAKWTYQPNPDTYEAIYLVKDQGVCYLQPDFENPKGNTRPATEEKYERVELTQCACDLKILIHPWKGNEQNPASINLVAGRCSCWDYFCAQCRCVPVDLCAYAFIDGQFYKNIRFSWNPETKCWTSNGGVTIGGAELTETFTVCLGDSVNNTCEISLDRYGQVIPSASYSCENSIFSASFEYWDNETGESFSLWMNTAFDADCQTTIKCTQATTCADGCGTHPEVLNLTLHAYNDSYTYAHEPGFDDLDPCDMEVELHYWERVFNVGSENNPGIEILCGYVGWKSVQCTLFDGTLYWKHFRFEYAGLILDIHEITQSHQGPIYDMGSEVCDPYEASYAANIALNNCFWGCDDTIQRVEVDIVE